MQKIEQFLYTYETEDRRGMPYEWTISVAHIVGSEYKVSATEHRQGRHLHWVKVNATSAEGAAKKFQSECERKSF